MKKNKPPKTYFGCTIPLIIFLIVALVIVCWLVWLMTIHAPNIYD